MPYYDGYDEDFEDDYEAFLDEYDLAHPDEMVSKALSAREVQQRRNAAKKRKRIGAAVAGAAAIGAAGAGAYGLRRAGGGSMKAGAKTTAIRARNAGLKHGVRPVAVGVQRGAARIQGKRPMHGPAEPKPVGGFVARNAAAARKKVRAVERTATYGGAARQAERGIRRNANRSGMSQSGMSNPSSMRTGGQYAMKRGAGKRRPR